MNIRLKLFIFTLIISPLFWWQLISPQKQILSTYSNFPGYIHQKLSSLLLNTQYIDEFRWNDSSKDNRPLIGHFFYNKARIILDQIPIYLNNLNPRFYFQSGSGQIDSPPQVEPIIFLLFPISFAGIFRLIKNKKSKVILLGLISPIFGYLTGQTNFYFLFPTAIFYLYTAAYEVSFWKKKSILTYLTIISIYSLFLFFRVILIKI